MAKYIQEETMSGSMIVEFWLARASPVSTRRRSTIVTGPHHESPNDQ